MRDTTKEQYEKALKILRDELEFISNRTGEIICERTSIGCDAAISDSYYITGEWEYDEKN